MTPSDYDASKDPRFKEPPTRLPDFHPPEKFDPIPLPGRRSVEMEQAKYLKGRANYVIQNYGYPEEIANLNDSQKEKLKAIILETQRQVSTWQNLNPAQTKAINKVCNDYLSKLN